MTRSSAGLCFLGAAALLLAACTPAANRPPAVLDAARLAGIENWEFRGRVALNAQGKGAQANVEWLQAGPLAQLELSGPWGVGAERVRIEGEDVSRLSEGEWVPMCVPGLSVDELQLLCESAPLRSLPFWLRGLPDPAHPHVEYNSGQGAAREFQQQGWRIEVSAVARSGDLGVPRRLRITGPGAAMKVAITRWELPSSP